MHSTLHRVRANMREAVDLGFAALSYVSKKLHYHVAHRPHQHLMRRWSWYERWHNWHFHGHAHVSVLVIYLFVVGATVLFFHNRAYADTTQAWNFANASDFVFDDSKIEIDGTTAKLKAQNYSPDANTVGLWHMDEESGTAIVDATTNSNDGTIQGSALFTVGKLNNSLELNDYGEFASIPDSASLSLGGQHTLEAWTKFENGFSTDDNRDAGIIDKGSYRLYYDRTSGKINYEIASNTANSWTREGGLDAKNSWDVDGKTIVRSTISSGGTTYVGLGLGVGDAEVWRWNGTSWSKIGGDGVNSSWADQVFEDVNSLFLSGTTLYAGIGSSVGDAEVWSCNVSTNCASWSKIGGDGVNSSWAISTFESVLSMTAFGGNLYAALGINANDAEVWQWNGSSWTKIGGDSLNSGWTTNYDSVRSLANDGTNLYAGLGDTATEAEVWLWNGTSWSKIGGDGVSSSWASGDNIEYVHSLEYFNGNLYAGTASSTGDGDLWRWNGTTWSKIGGDGVNSGWPASTYEIVSSVAAGSGSTIYAGLSSGNGDGEVFSWDGTSWTKIGGDGVNGSWASARGDGVYALSFSDGVLYAGIYDSGGNSGLWAWNGSTWTQLGGGYVNSSWGFYGLNSVESSTTMNEKLYVGTGISVAGNAMVWEFDGSSWRVVGGQGVNGSWAQDTFENVYTLQQYEGELYAGLGVSANDAEVWKYNGTSWTKVGGDSLNNGWGANFEAAQVLVAYGDHLYAGLGNSANDAEVWRWDGASWEKVGGDSLNSGWTTNFEAVLSMTVYNGNMYAGLGSSTNDAEVWRWNGSSWAKVGGDGVGGSWDLTHEEVFIMRVYNAKLVVGVGSGTGDAEVWQYDESTWSKFGGDDVSGSWTDGTYERIRAMAIYNGELFVGIGDTAGDGEVWKWNGSTWEKIGGNSINSGWTNVIEYVSTLIDYKGKLYAGTGNSANADATVWSYGNNAFLSSNASSQDSAWHHIAATYNGTAMKIFIDGVENASSNASVIMTDNSLPVHIGSTHGSGGRGESQGYLNGNIDEVRISNVARTGFTSRPYSTNKETITLANTVFTSGVQAFTGFSAIEQLNGGSIGYQLSDNSGVSWRYWDGDEWSEAGTLNDSNSQSEVNQQIGSFPVGFGGLRWRAILNSDGAQQVTLDSVTVQASEDLTPPSVNAANPAAYKSFGGSSIAENSWTNGGSPYFTWDAGDDAGVGLYGYCLYLGQDNTADPTTTKGNLGVSPAQTGGNCQFITTEAAINLATPNLLGTALTTSNSSYYLRVSAIDKAGNISPTPVSFAFRFDNTPPSNPGFISAPSGFINTKEATLTWPTSGGQAASDSASGLVGLQYRIGPEGIWYGDVHDGSGSTSDLLSNDGSYTTIPTPDFNNIVDGTNTVYFRTWDNAGNVTQTYVSAALKINTNGSPSEPPGMTVTPQTNTVNQFSFGWGIPDTFVGDAATLNYCYTINIAPSVGTCTYTGPGIRSLPAGAYATLPGLNTLYVVARDESGSINYSSYSSITFTANTAAPGLPGNLDIVDVSIKASSKWRLAITWDVPTTNADGVTSYQIFRSTDGSNFTLAGTSSSTTYIDAGLLQIPYYYFVKACDSTNNCSATSAEVTLTPTGKFTEAANLIGEPVAANITTKKAEISWVTDRASDSKIALGTASGQYGAAEIGNSDQVSVHEIELDNLAAGTTYYYVVKWTDVDGNTGISQEYTFTTAPAPIMKEVVTSKIGLSDATISFTSVNAAKVNLYYGTSESFGGLQTINTSLQESAYNIAIIGLNDGEKYFYQLSAIDTEGSEYRGNIFSFTTPQRPRINNLRFQPVEGEPTSTQSVTWDTNVPGTSTLTYGKVGTGGTDIQNSELKTDHKISISGLQDDSEYFLIAQSRDRDGNLTVSDRQIFRTALDTRPPSVFDVTIESSIRGSGSEARGQVIVSWKTDEPATSQVGYADGSTATVFNNKTSEDTQLTTEHIVVLSNLPTSKVYSIQAMSFDRARNIGVSEPQTEIIGRANESVLTIILNSLQRIFGL